MPNHTRRAAVMENVVSSARDWIIHLAPGLLRALLILAAGLLVAKLANRWLSAILDRSRISDDLLLRKFFLRVLSVSVIVASALSALDMLGLNVWSFAAGLGAAGIIIGFGLKDILSNFAAGILLLIYRPFRAGELIEVEGSTGTVLELTVVNMQLVTSDGVRVIMPNSKVWGAKIVNYSLSERRRIEMTLKVPETSIAQASEAISAALAGNTKVLKEPAPLVRVNSIAEKAATLAVSFWTAPADYNAVAAGQYRELRDALAASGVEVL